MAYGFTITAAGWELIGKLLQSENANLNIDAVWFGSGKVPDDVNPGTLSQLIAPEGIGTNNNPRHVVNYNPDGSVERIEIAFTVEYRSDQNPNVEVGFWINEFGLFSTDIETGEHVLLYYATLGDAPQYVTPISQNAVDIRRFPVKIVITEKIEITMSYEMDGFVTGEELVAYADALKPEWLALAQAQVNAHNADPEAHEYIRGEVSGNRSRIEKIEEMLGGRGSKSFYYGFEDLVGINLEKGVWDVAQGRIAF
jgi:hypothetical protein